MPQSGAFAGKVMLVTGAAQGIGEATARLMAARGVAALALVDRNGERLGEVAAELAGTGCRVATFAADLANLDDAIGAVDVLAARLGSLDGVVNAAGITDRGGIDDTSPALFDRIFAVNTRAPFFIIQRALPHLRRAGGGTIVNVLSITIWGGTPQLTAYVGAKGALAVMTRNIAASVARDRIRVNGLNLGWTLTPNERRLQVEVHGRPADWPDAVGRAQPFGRLLAPEDAARAICFLASDESALMTGAIVDFEQQVMGTYPVAPE